MGPHEWILQSLSFKKLGYVLGLGYGPVLRAQWVDCAEILFTVNFGLFC